MVSRDSDSQGGRGDDGAGREVRGQRASKEEQREDNGVEKASSVDIRMNGSVDGREDRTIEERAERDFRLGGS